MVDCCSAKNSIHKPVPVFFLEGKGSSRDCIASQEKLHKLNLISQTWIYISTIIINEKPRPYGLLRWKQTLFFTFLRGKILNPKFRIVAIVWT